MANTQRDGWQQGTEILCGRESVTAVCGEDVADPEVIAQRPGLRAHESRGERSGRSSDGSGASHSHDWTVEPDVGRVVDGLSLELDCFRRLNDWASDNPKAKSEAYRIIWRVLQFVWINRELAASSPDLYRKRLCGLVPGMPYETAFSRWLLGSRIEKDEELCDLWFRVYAAPFQEALHMFPELFERIGKKKRPKALGSRVHCLAALGDAIVPQACAEAIRRLMA